VWASGIAAIGFIFIAAFLAWQAEHQTVVNLRERNRQSEPDLVGSLEQTITSVASNGLTVGLIQVSIKNRGADSIAEHYECTIEAVKGHAIQGTRIYIPSTVLTDSNTRQPFKISQEASLSERTSAPIVRGGLVRGWLAFTFEGVSQGQMTQMGTKWAISFIDVADKKYTIEHTYGEKDTSGLQYYPGMKGELPEPR
jgi:hypothetical protein